MKTQKGVFRFDFNKLESQEKNNSSISKEMEHTTGTNKKLDCEKTNDTDSISAVELENMRKEAEKVRNNSQKIKYLKVLSIALKGNTYVNEHSK